MKWNQDDRMLLILYGEKTLPGTIASMQKIRSSLEKDETELDQMLAGVIRKLQQISEEEFERIGT
jgi:uncharacterized protein YqcC (DUF446 family)